jgi:hypothetical protein
MEFETTVLTHWFAPFTDGYQRPLPVGLEFAVVADPPATAAAVTAKPDPYEHWQSVLVDSKDISAEKYGGYSLAIPFDCLKTHCSRR